MKTIAAICFLLACSATGIVLADVVEGSQACPVAGTGKLIQMELTGCHKAPCHVKTATHYKASITFEAGEDAKDGIQGELFFLRPNGGVTRLDEIESTESITKGDVNSITSDFNIPARFDKNYGDIGILIRNKANGSRMMCGEFSVFVSNTLQMPPTKFWGQFKSQHLENDVV